MPTWILFRSAVVWGFGATLGKHLSKGLASYTLAYVKKKTTPEDETPEA